MEARKIWNQFDRLVGAPDEDIDLARAALLIAATEYPANLMSSASCSD